ncbi:MAG: cellulase family glycosylhydrolase, partial [Oscillospiraceae bacterium]|nr:cellulase family glycosylhydrolase [Oscillospiraceae bacterium]
DETEEEITELSETAASAPAETEKTSSQQTRKTTSPVSETKPAEKQNDKTDNAVSSKDVELILSAPNGWNDGTADYSQLDGTVKNNSSASVDGWTAAIYVGKSATIEQSWNCSIDLSGGKMTVTPVEHNKTIASGGEGTFGMILKNPGDIDTKKSELSCSMGAFSASSSGGDQSGGNNSSGGTSPKAPVQAKDVPAPTTDDWLSVKGNKIVDSSGREVWLTGVNWFGYNTGTNTFDGLWACDLNSSLKSIADHGFNLLRVPISAELINSWAAGNYPTANFNQATNSYLVGMNSLEIFDYVIGQCRANGIKIMIDIHSAKTDSMGHMKNMWYEGNVTEKDYLAALSWMAERYKKDDTIIAFDLKNEPHGKANENPRAKWDSSKDSDNWKYVAEKAAKAVLDKNPNVLVMVEGIEIYPVDIKKNGDFSSTNPGDYYSTWWGGNLRGVKNDPIDLGKFQNKLVYSPHDYGPAVYQQEWFKGDYTYNSLYRDAWYDNWFYIQDENIAPLLIGEWGGFMTQPNLKWMTYLRQLIKEKRINHTFWCFNANSGDTGGLVKDDFTTWDKEKYEFVKEVLWQEDGKFVGLDHEIPLGSNGKALGK